jgi:hypothetical protein
MRIVVRPLPFRVLGPILLLLLGGLVAIAPPASAEGSGTFTLRAKCPYLGNYDAGVYVTENFSGLTATPYSYKVVATRPADVGTDTLDPDTSGWYTEPDGSHAAGPFYDFAYNGIGPSPVVAPGDSWHWQLIRTYGEQTTVLQGDTVVQEATGCPAPPPPPEHTGTAPAPASFASSPHKVKVNHHGKFHYSFRGGAGLHGAIVIGRKGKTWAHGSFVVPSTGAETIGLRITKAARHYLATHHKAKTAVTVVLTNSYGSRSSGTTLVLRWA